MSHTVAPAGPPRSRLRPTGVLMRHSLRVERDGAVGQIVLLGPGQGNAMGPSTWSELPAALDELEADAAIRAVVVSGHGEHFSFGLDVGRMLETYDFAADRGAYARRELWRLIERMQHAFTRVQVSRLPVVAAIRGWCIGSGLELACACDLRYAQSGARFSLREVRLAIVADLGGLARLPGIVGEGHARELALTVAEGDRTRRRCRARDCGACAADRRRHQERHERAARQTCRRRAAVRRGLERRISPVGGFRACGRRVSTFDVSPTRRRRASPRR
jgi:enoyl-CoA hydratase/carnithine racemase